MLKYIINILILFIPFSIISQNINVSAKIDSMAIVIGDQTYLNLSVEQGKNDIVKFPEIKEKIIDGVDVIEVKAIDTQSVNNGIIVRQRILITAFEDSIYTIPPFTFLNNGDTLFSNSVMLSVQYPILDSVELAKIDTSQVLDIFDLEKPINTPFTFKEFWDRFSWIIFTVIGVILVVILVTILIKRAKNKKPIIAVAPKPKDPPHIVAIRELDKLKTKKLWQSGKVKKYYTHLTDILKEYLENRYNISTSELTSMELLNIVSSRQLFNSEVIDELRQVFSFSDLAKFAKFKPMSAENDLCMDYSYSIVEKTKLVETEKIKEDNDNSEKDDQQNKITAIQSRDKS